MEAVSESSQFSYYKHGVTKNVDTANVRRLSAGLQTERVAGCCVTYRIAPVVGHFHTRVGHWRGRDGAGDDSV